jgi:biotin transport system substrate-specific component
VTVHTATPALAHRRLVLADLLAGTLARDGALVAAGCVLTGALAQIQVSIPALSPVPFTAQTLAVLLVGAALGPWRAMASMLLYLGAGIAGVPWFAHGGSGYAFASFGYLIGFAVAAVAVGALARRGGDRTPARAAGTMALGNLLIYAFGVPVLAAATGMAPLTALGKGAGVFVLADAVKIAVAAGLLPGAWALVRRFHPAGGPHPTDDR